MKKFETANREVAYHGVERRAGDDEGEELVNAQDVAKTAEIKWY